MNDVVSGHAGQSLYKGESSTRYEGFLLGLFGKIWITKDLDSSGGGGFAVWGANWSPEGGAAAFSGSLGGTDPVRWAALSIASWYLNGLLSIKDFAASSLSTMDKNEDGLFWQRESAA